MGCYRVGISATSSALDAQRRLQFLVPRELVSEMKFPESWKFGSDFRRFLDDTGTVKRCFALEFRQKLNFFPLAAGSALRP
jgi:hypothetical protein